MNRSDFDRPIEYVKRMVKYSKGWLKFINEEKCEVKITDNFFLRMEGWHTQYSDIEELDQSDENLLEQGIVLKDDGLTFDGRLTYSRFYKVISDEGESMNTPEDWLFNDKEIDSFEFVDFSDKNSPVFGSKLFLLKFYILRKIDEVAFVTSRFVHCPACGANYVVPAAKIDFMQTYKCEKIVGDKQCKTTLKKFPARKMIPTYIYEMGVEVKSKDGITFREYFLESFVELHPGYFTGMCFGRTENKSNSFYFSCLTAKEEKSRHPFKLIKRKHNEHAFFNLVESIQKHVQKIGFIIDEDKAQLPIIVETLKKITVLFNKEVNMDHSLYFGAPGIGKTYALTMLHHLFYSNSGFISGPRFSLPGLTGGQKEIYYQDTIKKKNVPGLFSNQAFIFDEINNAQFLADDKAINLFKSVALVSTGTSSTVGGKEFPRNSLISATANYDINQLKYYENKVKKIYESENAKVPVQTQATFLDNMAAKKETIPESFDFYAPIRDYKLNIPKALKAAILKVRDDSKDYLTNFPKPLMERFYYSVLIHPKYDKAFLKQKAIDVEAYLKHRKSKYSNRELLSQLYAPDLDVSLKEKANKTLLAFDNKEIEAKWSQQTRDFLKLMGLCYPNFFGMFHRINQVHVFTLFALSLINEENTLSFATRRISERVISLLHTPIKMQDFHTPDFDKFKYIGETRKSVLFIIDNFTGKDMRRYIDFSRPYARKILVNLENERRIKKLNDYVYIRKPKNEVTENETI